MPAAPTELVLDVSVQVRVIPGSIQRQLRAKRLRVFTQLGAMAMRHSAHAAT